MKTLSVVMLTLLLMAGIVYAKDFEVKKKAGQYDVTIAIDKNPPVVGDNTLTIAVKDASGRNVTDAKVRAEYSMPGMPGMPPMNYKSEATLSGNVYKAKISPSMSGAWNVAVKVMRGGKTAAVKFTIDAH